MRGSYAQALPTSSGRVFYLRHAERIVKIDNTALALLHRKDGGKMDGIGLLITILFCGITYWGTSRYYITIIKDINAAWERNFDLMLKDKK